MYPNLKAELSRRGLSIRTFAILVGMPYSTLREKLKGERKLTYDEALKIKQSLNLSMPLEILFSTEIAS